VQGKRDGCAGPTSLAASVASRGGRTACSCLIAIVLLVLLMVPVAAPAAGSCPNEAVRAQSNVNPVTGKPYSTELPDCRAYELVSTGDKNDVDAMLSPLINGHSGTDNFGLVSEDGGQTLWNKEAELYANPNDGVSDVYEATRGPAGWAQSDALAPPGASGAQGFYIAAASSDLSEVLLLTRPTAEAEEAAGASEQLIERSADGSYTTIASLPDNPYGAFGEESRVDAGHTFFETSYDRFPGDTHIAGDQVYEWTSAGGLHAVGVNEAGEPVSSCGAVLASSESSPAGWDVSGDGSRVFFQSPDPHGSKKAELEYSTGAITLSERELVLHACKQPSELYVREDGSLTIEISKAPHGVPECEPGVSECEAHFVGASEDGSKVFFVTSSHLTPGNPNTDPNLYEYDVQTGALKRLSVGEEGYDDADVGTLYGGPASSAIVSGDGSHVYFTGLGQLVKGAGASAAENEAKVTVNLYVYADGSVSFIATVGPGSFPGENSKFEPPRYAPLNAATAAVTPDGSDLIFDSDSKLTEYDNEGRGELYRYDAPTHTIACISCNSFAPPNPNGTEAPVFHTSFWSDPHGTMPQFGGLSNNGETVFFASTEQLVPAATNVLMPQPIYNVYEWHDGVQSLISSGTSPSSDFLLGASASGSDVFFMSASQLVPQDGEHSYEIYDAHAEGGFPAPSAPEPCASAATCRSVAATPPVTIAPASVSVSGPGNVASVTETPSPVKPKVESRSEKLAKALKQCKRDKSRSLRVKCGKEAQKKYGAKAKATKKTATRAGRS